MCWRIISFKILMIKCLLFLITISLSVNAYAEDCEKSSPDSILTNSFWDNWYGQVGTDMTLLFPKGHAVKDVFPNGKSLGVSLAVGKWFSPEFGGRFKVKWNNGIIKDNYNIWYQPYGVKGGSYHDGGFLTFNGDIQINIHNLFGEYRPSRKWNLILAPHAGAWFNLGSGGGPLMGLGITNTYRINNRWRIFADLEYSFVASVNGVASGTDHGGNSYAEINVGVEMNLSKNNLFHRTPKQRVRYDKATAINSFWDNWFVQAGLGMSLINPYKTDIINVFPNGKTFGINLGVGKWFTPEVGVRGGFNWQNGIITNHHASYLAANDAPNGELDKRGFIALYADMFFNLHHIVGGYQNNRRWNAIVYPRAGLACNFSSSYEECPILGIGTEQVFSINNKTKIFADISYQATTGGFLDAKYDNSKLWDCSNGWFDINVGIQYELGKNRWDKPGDQRKVTHWEGGHNWPRFIVNTGASVIVAFGAKTALKAIVSEERPDHSDNKSFPSGHVSMAFAAARSIDKEFRKDCIWISIASYAAATAVGVERVVNKHHHWYDVAAGAAIGIGSAELTWWLSDLVFAKHNKCVAIGSSGNTLDVAYSF